MNQAASLAAAMRSSGICTDSRREHGCNVMLRERTCMDTLD